MFAGCRVLIRIASWILPRSERPEWVRKWEAAVRNWSLFLLERDGPLPATYARIAWACCRAFPDAFRLRFQPDNLRGILRRPAFVFAAAAAVFIGLAVLTAGFSGLRGLMRPLPFPDSRQLVLFGQTDVFGIPFGVRSTAVPYWQKETKLASGLAMYTLRPGRAAVGTNFFDLLGVRTLAGRTFRPGDEAAVPPPVVLTYRLWRSDFGSDRAVVGRTVSIDGRMVVVVGVLPRECTVLSRGLRYFTALDASRVPWTIGLLGRLKPGATPDKLRSELLGISRAHKQQIRYLSSGMRLVPLERPLASRFAIYAVGLLIGIMLAAVLVFIERLPLAAGWRYWFFLAGKVAVSLTILIALWIELAAAIPAEFMAGLAFNWVSLIACGCAVYWAFFDQRRRCPVCLQRLAMPVTIGSWSSVLEPVSTELLCERGHGALCIPETQSSASEPDSWTSMDDSWRELFTR